MMRSDPTRQGGGRRQTLKVLNERVDRVAQIIKSAEGRPAEALAKEIIDALEGDAVMGFNFTRPDRSLIIMGVRESPDSARPSGGEGNPISVLVMRPTMPVVWTGRQRR